MASIESTERVVHFLGVISQIIDSFTREDIHYWLDVCNGSIRELQEVMNKPNLSRGENQRCLTCSIPLSCIQAKFENYLQSGGSLNAESETKVEWRDTQSAFKNRIRTGVVVNLKHVDILSFLRDV